MSRSGHTKGSSFAAPFDGLKGSSCETPFSAPVKGSSFHPPKGKDSLHDTGIIHQRVCASGGRHAE